MNDYSYFLGLIEFALNSVRGLYDLSLNANCPYSDFLLKSMNYLILFQSKVLMDIASENNEKLSPSE